MDTDLARAMEGKGAAVVRPDVVLDEHLTYLDALRESGVTNMFGARPYLEREFGLDKDEAGTILTYWMKSFSERHRPVEAVDEAAPEPSGEPEPTDDDSVVGDGNVPVIETPEPMPVPQAAVSAPAEIVTESSGPADEIVVFAFRLTRAERAALKHAAAAAGFGRKHGGVTGWARAALAACAAPDGGGSPVAASDVEQAG